MSSLFADTMRAALVANASGFYETPEEQAKRLAEQERYAAARVGLCPSDFEFYEDRFVCDLPDGHDGEHRTGEDEPESTHRWEVRWSERD